MYEANYATALYIQPGLSLSIYLFIHQGDRKHINFWFGCKSIVLTGCEMSIATRVYWHAFKNRSYLPKLCVRPKGHKNTHTMLKPYSQYRGSLCPFMTLGSPGVRTDKMEFMGSIKCRLRCCGGHFIVRNLPVIRNATLHIWNCSHIGRL